MSDELTTQQLADELEVSKKTLERWRAAGEGPAYQQWSKGTIRYTREAVDAWKAAQTVEPT